MIKVNILKDKDMIKEITISGHALYDDYGKDIVCAAVSSTVITTINGIMMINESIDANIFDDKVTIRVLYNDDITFKLLTNMINNLSELESEYNKYIKILIKEV